MSREQTSSFELPKKLEKLLAALATYYGQNNKPLLQRVLVNSSYRVHEKWSYDNWNGGTYGHAVYFQVPAPIYYEIFDSLDGVSKEICEGVNRISNVQNEFVEQVFLEIKDDPAFENWRERSGVLVHTPLASLITSEEQLAKLWKPGYLRLFISHKAEHKKLASQFKGDMECFGVSCFVAHEDIEPTKEWQDEIEKALFSMDALLVLMTEDFHDSHWTDQEVGVAIGRQVLVIPIRLGMDPYGLIGKYQAISPSPDAKMAEITLKVAASLLQHEYTSTRLIDAYIGKLRASVNYAESERLAGLLPFISKLTEAQVKAMLEAFNANSQVYDCFAFNGEKPWSYGAGLPAQLHRITGHRYEVCGHPKQIREAKE